jgi:hypothetical protein
MVTAEFPFDELIYSWKVLPPRDEGFRLFLQVRFKEGDESPWLYGGYWGAVQTSGTRTNPKFDRGEVLQDQLVMKEKARAFRFKVVSKGPKLLTELPLLHVITTDTTPTQQMREQYGLNEEDEECEPRVLDIPLCTQTDIGGDRFPNRCQSAAVSAAMSYFGKDVALENIIGFATDVEYKSYGIWPRTIGAAHEHGFDGYIDRFRDWNSVCKTLAENKVILCSIKMPRGKGYVAPPYPSMGGHIVALNGITDDGRVIVTDSAKSAGDGYCLQWLKVDFEKIWMLTKGGVGMVICPPPGAKEKLVKNLPPFPRPIPTTYPDDKKTTK